MSASGTESAESGGPERPPGSNKKKKKTKAAVITDAVMQGLNEEANKKELKTTTLKESSTLTTPAVADASTTDVPNSPETSLKKTIMRTMVNSAPSTSTAKTDEFPGLIEVVKTASASAPEPSKTIMRPPLSKTPLSKSTLKKNSAAVKVASTPPSNIIMPGVSYAQQVSGSSNKASIVEIEGSYVAPRPPPSDAGVSRPKSDARLQGLFDGRWQDDRYGMYFEQIRGSTQGTYLKALASVIPRENIFSFGMVGKGMVEVFTTTLEAATKLMLEGIEVSGRHLQPYPVSIKPTRVVFSRVPMRIDHVDLIKFLQKFGKVHGKVRAIPLKVGDEGLGRGIFSTSREAFVTLNKGCTLPSGFYLNVAGSRTFIDVTTEAKCFACHQVGHFVVDCPRRTKKVAEKKGGSDGVSTPVVASEEVLPLPPPTPALVGQPAKSPETVFLGTKSKLAESDATSIPEDASFSEEEATMISSKKEDEKKKNDCPGDVAGRGEYRVCGFFLKTVPLL